MYILKRLVGLFLLIFSIPSFGYSESYVGFGIGPEYASFKQKSLVGRTLSTGGGGGGGGGGGDWGFPWLFGKSQFLAKGGFVSLFTGLGYGFSSCDSNCDKLYLGIEANADLRNLRYKMTYSDIDVNFTQTTFRMRYDVGVSLLPGVLLPNCLLFYTRLGYANGRFNADTANNVSQNIAKNLSAFRYGVGFRRAINTCWALRIEFSKTDYQKAKMYLFDPVGKVSDSITISPRVQKLELSLVYIF